MGYWLRNVNFITLVIVFSVFSLKAQEIEKLDALNTYVQFLNESVHGLFTAHALLVISNKEVNRYIDMDSYIINNISNAEVQSNLFAKSDKANYTTFHTFSPMELRTMSKEKSKHLNAVLARKLNEQVEEIVKILTRINQIRLDIDVFIKSHDLTEKESIYGVFEYLEEGVLLFENFAKKHSQLSFDIKKSIKRSDIKLVSEATDLHEASQIILRRLRSENDTNVEADISTLQDALNAFRAELIAEGIYNSSAFNLNVEVKIERIIDLMKQYARTGEIPKEHEIYGKYYFYHNEIAKRYYNWSGPGFVRRLSKIIEDLKLPFLQFVEEPLIFKVIYPMKKDEIKAIIQSQTEPVNRSLPIAKERELKLATPAERRVQEEHYVTIEMVDFNMLDRDSISVNYNGEWILKNHMLQRASKGIKLALRNDQENYIVFRAENEGIRAPNTFQVAYRYSGTRQKRFVQYSLRKGDELKLLLGNPND